MARRIAAGIGAVAIVGALAISSVYEFTEPSLPSAEAMRSVELQVPLRIYARNGQLIAQIGEQRRTPVTYAQIPEVLKRAFLAAEDDRFFEHHGIDYPGVVRAMLVNIVSGNRAQGASTITMQAARNMFLSLDKTWRRKIQEMFLTYRMEHEFTKEQILGLYLNVIFFGQRSYGVAAAAETFFGKSLDQLTVAEAATLAGIPQAPSRYNPIVNPQLAKARRSYVLRRMTELGFIDPATAEAANAEPVIAHAHAPLFDVEAPYVAEMARLEMRRRFGPAAESAGYRVITTLDSRLQAAANRAVRLGLIEYDRRHGWRGPIGTIQGVDASTPREKLEKGLEEYADVGILSPAVVTQVEGKSAQVFVKQSGPAEIEWDGMSWARRDARQNATGTEAQEAGDILAAGEVVYVVAGTKGAAQLAQLPVAQSALVAVDPHDGAISALVGGFDYFANKYNRVTQAQRQPGSGFKPFLYSAALENGFTPASVILDAPIVLDDESLEASWRPENSGGQFHGPTRLREALVRSRNLVSIRLLRELGTSQAIDYVTRFGFPRSALPNNLTMALGTMQATPLEIAEGYAIFANGGYRVQPYFIDRIENSAGEVIWRADPRVACSQCDDAVDLSGLPPIDSRVTLDEADAVRGGRGFLPPDEIAPRAISPQNAYLMRDMMLDVVRRGTGRRALALGRADVAGKTGTTNDARDAWFNGFTPDLVATAWVGFDQGLSLGESEEGAKTALPIWLHFMREALKATPVRRPVMPPGLVTLRVSASTGQLVSADNPDGILETFMVDHLPDGGTFADQGSPTQGSGERATSDSIF